jgi:hypothetical protein
LDSSADWSREGGHSGALYGYSVGTAGDVNGDGYADVILGAPLMNSSLTDEGVARIYLGSAVGLRTTYAWSGEGEQGSSWYGQSVGTAGDVDGDGYADVIVGAPNWQSDSAHINEGHALVYFGNDGPGVGIRPRQTQTDATPLANLGITHESVSFRIYSQVGTPFGRGGLQQMFEVKPLNESFDGTHTIWWGFYDNLVAGTDRYMVTGSLSPGVVYHWRVRLCYDPATTPWMPCSRWVTIPWNGWNEQDVRIYGMQIHLPVILK